MLSKAFLLLKTYNQPDDVSRMLNATMGSNKQWCDGASTWTKAKLVAQECSVGEQMIRQERVDMAFQNLADN